VHASFSQEKGIGRCPRNSSRHRHVSIMFVSINVQINDWRERIQIKILIDRSISCRRDRDKYGTIDFFFMGTRRERSKNIVRNGKRGKDCGNTLVDVHSAGFGRTNSSTVWHRSTPVGARFCRLRETERMSEKERDR